MKLKLVKISSILVIVCSCLSVLVLKNNAQAYYHINKNKTAECFAVSYYLAEGTEGSSSESYHVQGEKVDVTPDYHTGKTLTSNKICAYVDSSGAIKGELVDSNNMPKDVTPIGSPRLELTDDKKGLFVTWCPNGGSVCLRKKKKKSKTFYIKDYKTFRAFATDVNNAAPAEYKYFLRTASRQALVDSNGNPIATTDSDALKDAISQTSSNDDEEGGSDVVEDCANQGGAQSLGWIICPIMSLLGDAAEGLYNSAVEPALNIEPKLFSDSNTNTAGAWGIFRNIANVIFVILMLLVIFSQLTGVGIDNYGIKKILPKLIVVAVLTNLSYVLCVLAIDVSNILGNSFQGLFEGMRGGLDLTLDFKDGTVIGNQIKNTAGSMVGVGVLGALVGMSGGIWEAPMVALSLLLGAIGVVVSIFFLFVLLAAREAAIVVLVVLAPVAMVLYALPNTKKVFDKWLKAFEGLLLVYPIAGLLVGGGNYVSALLIHSGMGSDFFGALTAMIAGVLPIFFIPTMLKGSFSALGTIGARISGFGAGASRGVTRALGNSGAYKNMQESARMWADKSQAGTGDISKMGRFGKAIRGGERGITAARARNIRNVKDYGNRELLATGAGYGAALAGAESENMKQRVAGYESLLAGDNELGEGGSKVNANNIDGNGVDSLKSFHRNALSEYANASTNEERDTAMAKIRAVQNIMSKTDSGRSAVATNIANSVTAGGNSAVAASNAASHLMSEYGDLYKTKNRGTEQMLRDLTGGNKDYVDEDTGKVNMDAIANNINNKTYGMAGTKDYTEETLAGADEAALQGLIDNLSKMDNEQLQNIQGTASRAIQKSASGNLSVQPKVLNKLKEINNYRRTVDNTGDFIPE